jgi:hypothetical protein
MRVRGEKVFWLTMKVGEIAASAAGDQNFLPQPVRMFQHRNAPAAPARFDGAHQSRRATAKNECIEGMGHGRQIQELKPVFIVELYAALKAPLFHVTAGVREEHRSHIEQAQAWQAVFFQKSLVDVLLL